MRQQLTKQAVYCPPIPQQFRAGLVIPIGEPEVYHLQKSMGLTDTQVHWDSSPDFCFPSTRPVVSAPSI